MPMLTVKTKSQNEFRIPFKTKEEARSAYSGILQGLAAKASDITVRAERGEYRIDLTQLDLIFWENATAPEWLVAETAELMLGEAKARQKAQYRMQTEVIEPMARNLQGDPN